MSYHSHRSHCSSPESQQPQLPNNISEECEISAQDSENDERRREGLSRERNVQCLCPCTETTVDDVVFMALALGVRHSLPWVAQVDILKMIGSIFKDVKLPMTKDTYIKSLDVQSKDDIKYHIFCDVCATYLGEKQTQEKVKKCISCSKNVSVLKPSNFFVMLSIESQIQKYLKDEKFVNDILTYRFKRDSKPGVFSDIFDGEIYKKLSEDGGVLSSPYNFSYTFFTDGIAYGKSNKTIWPIYLSFNELPYEDRSKYYILAGVYSGSKDPNQAYFLKPFVTAANQLSRVGISWVHGGKSVNSIIIPLCFVADSVARYQMLNLQAYNAYYGCTFCYKKMELVRGGPRFLISEPAPERTDYSWGKDLEQVHRNKLNPLVPQKEEPYRGVKGACNLLDLDYFSINYCVVDYMHAILVGCVKAHMELILDPARNKMWIGVAKNLIGMDHVIKTIDSRIKSIQSNTTIIRELRPLTDRKLWKASELRSWLLFYSIPCLSGILKNKYVLHLAMLSKATFLLLQKSVTLEDIDEAHKLFVIYSFYFQEYFGEESMLYNVHILSHIAKCVKNFGPIFLYSSFPYEAENSFILQCVQSPFSVSYQIARKFIIFKTLPLLCKEIVHSQRTLVFCEKLLNNRKLVNCVRANDNKCILLGSPTYYCCSEEEKLKLLQCIDHGDFNDCFLYERLLFRKRRYTTEAYCVGKDNNDSSAFLLNGQCVLIKYIISIPAVSKVLLYVQKIQVSKRPMLKNENLSYDTTCKITNFSENVFVKLECLAEPCFIIRGKRSGESYVSRIPYGCTAE